MPVLVSLLRGINVGGNRRIRMETLKEIYASLGFQDIDTYIQSGNVVFKSRQRNTAGTESLIQEGIRKSTGFDIPVIVRTSDELATLVASNPFLSRRSIELERLHVGFMDSEPSRARVKTLPALPAGARDEFQMTGKDIYMYNPNRLAKTPLTNAYFENHLGVALTVRNWNTVRTLHTMCRGKH